MIQRIQSVYLLLVAILSLGLTFFLSLWKEKSNEIFVFDLFSNNEMLLKVIPICFFIAGVLALISLFMFKNRKLQFVLNRLSILVNLILLGILLYYLLNVSGEMKISEKGIGVYLPIVSIFLLVFANRRIQKDENLVKSVDRLR